MTVRVHQLLSCSHLSLKQCARYTAIAIASLFAGLTNFSASAGIIALDDVSAVTPLLTVGNSAAGSLTVNGGSVLDGAVGLPPGPTPFSRILIGGTASGSGNVNVDGSGSKLLITGPVTQPGLDVGHLGIGTLNITNAGLVSAQRVHAGNGAGVTGTISVTGAGSILNSASVFGIGGNGTATATISAGGVVNAQTSNIATNHASNGMLTITGANSALNLVTGASPAFGRAFLNVGREQTGRLDILAGGKVLIDATPIGTTSVGVSIGGAGGTPSAGGSFANGNGTLNIDGGGSELRIKQTNPVTNVGRQGGTGTVNITNGGKLITENMAAGSSSFVGRDLGGTGTVNVGGAGSEWQSGRRLRIGQTTDSSGATIDGGTGLVKIADGAVLRSEAISLGSAGTLTGGGGTVIGNITNRGTIAPGNSPGVMTVQGDITLDPLGMVKIELAGTNVTLGEHDQLNAYDNPNTTAQQEGRIFLGGKLDVDLFNGFAPVGGSFFDVFTALDIIETNPLAFDLPSLGNGLQWGHALVDLGNGREALRLTVAAVPEPNTVALLGLGLVVAVWRRRVARA